MNECWDELEALGRRTLEAGEASVADVHRASRLLTALAHKPDRDERLALDLLRRQ